MTDVRQDILTRLLAVVATIPNLHAAYRNNDDIPEDQFPVAIVLDGDEETDDNTDATMRPPNRPTLVQMTPDILILNQDPNFGADLDPMRRELIKRVLTDTELNEQIVKTGRHGNGAIRYLGCQFGHAWLRNLHGAMKAQFLFKYMLRPDDL
jgi:hypothetical protein